MFYVKKTSDDKLVVADEYEENVIEIDGDESEFYRYYLDLKTNSIYKRQEITYSVEVNDGTPTVVFDYDRSIAANIKMFVSGSLYFDDNILIEKARVCDEITGELIQEIIPSFAIDSTINCSIVLESIDSKVSFNPIYVICSDLVKEDNPEVELSINKVTVSMSKLYKEYTELKKEVSDLKLLTQEIDMLKEEIKKLKGE